LPIRVDVIVLLALDPEGLQAEWGGGQAVRLAGTPCSTALQLGLLEAIGRVGRGDDRAVIIMPPAEPDSSAWQWMPVDVLLARC
jgi:hypothetical protein